MTERFRLNNGMTIPKIGFGTYKAAADGTERVISEAIQAGYRYFDTASFYGTEEALGKAWTQSNLERGAFQIASKAWKSELGYREVRAAFEKSLERLRTDYLDLYLIHWPLPAPDYQEWEKLDLDTWKLMEELYQEGKVRAIGVSNFLPQHLLNLMEHAEVVPAVDQLEFHPGHTQEVTLRFCQEKGIQVQAWSPLGRSRVLTDPLIVSLAEKYGVSSAQLCLQYDLQRGVMAIPKASSPERMRQNLNLGDFKISQIDMYRIDTMPDYGWSGEHPERERVDIHIQAHEG